MKAAMQFQLFASVFRIAIAAVALTASCTAAMGQEAPTISTNWDLMILMDGSGSVGNTVLNPGVPTDWDRERNFARDLVSLFTFGPADTAASLGAYGTTAQTFLNMSELRQSVLSTISSMFPPGGNSCQTCAFELASAQFADHGRAGLPKVTIFITDGLNNVRTEEFSTALAQLQATSTVFAVGIGTGTIVDQIASDLPGIQTAFVSNSFIDLPSLIDPMSNSFTLYAESLAPVAAIPEPETYAMLLAGLALLGFTARLKRR